jgi:biotin/methionine sulfoxide reductase
MHRVIDPVGQSRNDFDIFAELSHRLGFAGAYTEGRDEMGWLAHMYERAREAAWGRGYALPPFDEFWQDGIYEFPVARGSGVLFESFRRDPATHRLRTPSGKIEIFSQTIAQFRYDDCPPHPTCSSRSNGWAQRPLADFRCICSRTNRRCGCIASSIARSPAGKRKYPAASRST